MARKDPFKRFWAKVDKNGPIMRPELDPCWTWTGSVAWNYGSFFDLGKHWVAHRWIYKETVGEIPKGLEVCHHCDNKLCVNPSHLYAATHRQNMCDAQDRGLIPPCLFTGTHCRNGHPRTPENLEPYLGRTTRKRDIYLRCIQCRREANRRWMARQREKAA